jgi:hypothetical protein
MESEHRLSALFDRRFRSISTEHAFCQRPGSARERRGSRGRRRQSADTASDSVVFALSARRRPVTLPIRRSIIMETNVPCISCWSMHRKTISILWPVFPFWVPRRLEVYTKPPLRGKLEFGFSPSRPQAAPNSQFWPSRVTSNATPSPAQGSIADDGASGKQRNLRIRWASDNGSGKNPSLLLPWKRNGGLLSLKSLFSTSFSRW